MYLRKSKPLEMIVHTPKLLSQEIFRVNMHTREKKIGKKIAKKSATCSDKDRDKSPILP